jgi:hypothetical protein
MDSKIGAAAVLLTSVILGFGAGSAMTQAARAQEGAGSYASCGSPSPCLVESNTSSGPGLKSSSNRGIGLIATTKALGSTSTNGGSALFGQDLQKTTGDGVFNVGVNGTSTNGTGVQGSGGAAGVLGVATSATAIGVEAATTNTNGLLFEGSGKEIGNGLPVFTLDAYGHAIFGVATPGYESGSVTVNQRCGNGTPMFEGDNQNGLQFQVSDCGDVIDAGSMFVGTTLDTSTIRSFTGNVSVSDNLIANNGFASSVQAGTLTNYSATDATNVLWLYRGYSTDAGKFTVEMGDSGSVYARIFITTGAPIVAQKTSAGSRVDTYAPQSAQPSLEDFGEAQLTDGAASVPLDPRFAAAMDNTMRYYVMLTPEGDCRGVYVARRDNAGFTVRELQGGRSSIAFTYRIVARPLGDNSARLPVSTLPYGFEHKVPPPQVHRAPHRVVRDHSP